MLTLQRSQNRLRIVVIDGRSGAGKTTIANALASRVPRCAVLHLEQIYPGWDGLAAASSMLVRDVLSPLRAGRPARVRRWDWVAEAPAQWLVLRPSGTVIVEGAGSLSRAAKRLADLSLWVELDERSRRRRALQRDGAAYAPYWERWAAHEAAFIAREHPRRLADLVVRPVL
jgi:uridine kinase